MTVIGNPRMCKGFGDREAVPGVHLEQTENEVADCASESIGKQPSSAMTPSRNSKPGHTTRTSRSPHRMIKGNWLLHERKLSSSVPLRILAKREVGGEQDAKDGT